MRQRGIDALVCGSGADTRFGKTPHRVPEARTVSHLRRAVLRIGNGPVVLAAALVAVIILVALFRGEPLPKALQFALVLTVAASPMAMPTVPSVTMAVGAALLAGKEAIGGRLAAIE